MGTLQLKRATVAGNDNYIGEPGEIVVLTDDSYRAVVHDGTTSGGYPLALESELGGLVAIIDDFEDNDIAEYAGDTGQFSVQTGIVKGGSYALQMDTGGVAYHISSTAGLPNYPTQGDTIRVWGRLTGSNDQLAFTFGEQSETGEGTQSGYAVQFDKFDTKVTLRRYDNGSNTTLDALANPGLNLDAWYEIKIEWGTDDVIAVTILDDTNTSIGSLTATDANYTSGGVGWRVNASSATSTMYADDARIV